MNHKPAVIAKLLQPTGDIGGETIPLQRLCHCYGRRPKTMHFKEHTGPAGRLHLNVLWDWPWLNQRELSTLAAACGFGPICHISRVGRPIELAQGRPGSSAAVRYSTKTGFRVFAYARKTGGRTALVGRRAGVASGIAALTVLALSADRKFEPWLYHYDEWLARQRRAWAPRGPDGQFRIATE